MVCSLFFQLSIRQLSAIISKSCSFVNRSGLENSRFGGRFLMETVYGVWRFLMERPVFNWPVVPVQYWPACRWTGVMRVMRARSLAFVWCLLCGRGVHRSSGVMRIRRAQSLALIWCCMGLKLIARPAPAKSWPHPAQSTARSRRTCWPSNFRARGRGRRRQARRRFGGCR